MSEENGVVIRELQPAVKNFNLQLSELSRLKGDIEAQLELLVKGASTYGYRDLAATYDGIDTLKKSIGELEASLNVSKQRVELEFAAKLINADLEKVKIGAYNYSPDSKGHFSVKADEESRREFETWKVANPGIDLYRTQLDPTVIKSYCESQLKDGKPLPKFFNSYIPLIISRRKAGKS